MKQENIDRADENAAEVTKLEFTSVADSKDDEAINAADTGMPILQSSCSVNLSGQGLTDLPATLCLRPNITDLNLSDNNLRFIPPAISELASLRSLNLSRNDLGEDTLNRRRLYFMRYRRNLLPVDPFPLALVKLSGLRRLVLSGCCLCIMPSVIFRLNHLRELDVSRNGIKELPPEIGLLEKLRNFDISYTELTCLPPEFLNCRKLEKLRILGTKLRDLPQQMNALDRLHTLEVYFPQFLEQRVNNLLKQSSLTENNANISENEANDLVNNTNNVADANWPLQQIQVNCLPPILFHLKSLRELNLYNCKLSWLPNDMSGLANLRSLNLSDNNFHEVPKGIASLSERLIVLDISSNMLEEPDTNLSFPFGAGPKNLEQLFLRKCNLETVMQSSLKGLTKLMELDLSENRISKFPETIFSDLINLNRLSLAGNCLRSLPQSIANLTYLHSLDASNTRLSDIPFSIERLVNLVDMHTFRGLQRHGLWLLPNNLSDLPAFTWRTKTTKWLRHFLQVRQNQIDLNSPKLRLIVVGNRLQTTSDFISGLLRHFSGFENMSTTTPIRLSQRRIHETSGLQGMHSNCQAHFCHFRTWSGLQVNITYLPIKPNCLLTSSTEANLNFLLGHVFQDTLFHVVALTVNTSKNLQSEFKILQTECLGYMQTIQYNAPGAILQLVVLLEGSLDSKSFSSFFEQYQKKSLIEERLVTFLRLVEQAVQSAYNVFIKTATMQRVRFVNVISIIPNISDPAHLSYTEASLQTSEKVNLSRSGRFTATIHDFDTFAFHVEHCHRLQTSGASPKQCPLLCETFLQSSRDKFRQQLFVPIDKLQFTLSLMKETQTEENLSEEQFFNLLDFWKTTGSILWLQRHPQLKNYVIFKPHSFFHLATHLFTLGEAFKTFRALMATDTGVQTRRIEALVRIKIEKLRVIVEHCTFDSCIPSELANLFLSDDIIEQCCSLIGVKVRPPEGKPRYAPIVDETQASEHSTDARLNKTSEKRKWSITNMSVRRNQFTAYSLEIMSQLIKLFGLGISCQLRDEYTEFPIIHTAPSRLGKFYCQAKLTVTNKSSALNRELQNVLIMELPNCLAAMVCDRIISALCEKLTKFELLHVNLATGDMMKVGLLETARRTAIEFENGTLLVCLVQKIKTDITRKDTSVLYVNVDFKLHLQENDDRTKLLIRSSRFKNGSVLEFGSFVKQTVSKLRDELPGANSIFDKLVMKP